MNVTIGKLAQMAGVGVETIRYYQRRGLLAVPAVAGGGHGGSVRRYDRADLNRLNFIRSAQGAGFTLNEIKELLEYGGKADKAEVRTLALRRVAELDDKIAQMSHTRAALAQLASQCAAQNDDPNAPCPILSAFEAKPECATNVHR